MASKHTGHSSWTERARTGDLLAAPRFIPDGMGEEERRAFAKIAHRGCVEAVHLYTLLGIGLECYLHACEA